MNALLPSPTLMRSRAWLLAALLLAATTVAASIVSYEIALTELAISPMLLTPGIGTAVLNRWGRSLWPAFAAGDVIGQFIIRDRGWSLILLSVVVHLIVVLIGATWLQRTVCRLRDLGSNARYVGISVVLSLVGAGGTMLLVLVHGQIPADETTAILSGLLLMGYLGGFLVAGALILAWGDPDADASAEIRRPFAVLGFLAVVALAVAGFAFSIGFTVPLGLLGVLGLAARAGIRWGTAGISAVTIVAITGSARGLAPFGGQGAGEQAVNAMLAVSLFAAAVIFVAGYRTSGEPARPPAAVVATLFAVLMVITGISALAANAVAIDRDTPYVLSGLLALGAALGLAVLRSARAPARPCTRAGAALAAISGAVYILNLALYLQAVPLIGSGPATALTMTAPLAVLVLAFIVYRKRPSLGTAVGVGIIVVGAIVIAEGMMSSPVGLILALVSAWVFAASLILTNMALSRGGVVDITLIAATSSAVVALAVGLVVEGPGAFVLTPSQLGEITLGALGAQLVPLLGRSWALGQIGPGPVGAEGVLAPVTTAVLAMWFIDSATSGSAVAGLIVIASGALLSTLATSRVTSEPDGRAHGLSARLRPWRARRAAVET